MSEGHDPAAADRRTDLPENIASPRPSVAPGWDEPVDTELDPAVVPDPADVEVPADLRAEIEGYLARYPDRHSAALPALHAAQRVHGWCSPEALAQVAAVMGVTPAYLSSITTFYDMFLTQPLGSRYVYVCTGVACSLRRARELYEAMSAAGEGAADVNVREFECLGACDMAPMASANGRYVGPLDPDEAAEVVAAVAEGREALPGRGLEGLAESGRGRWSKEAAGG